MKRTALGTVLLLVAMIFGVETTIDAEVPTVAAGTEENGATVSITKDLEFAEGLEIPEVTFQFTATPITEGAPAAIVDNISYSSSDSKGSLINNKYIVSKNAAIVFEEFTHAGLYEYIVEETWGSEKGILYSQKRYKLRVYVANGMGEKLYVKTITAEDEIGKQEKIVFTNLYVRNDLSLEIEKRTVGDLADKTKDFEFTISLIVPDSVIEPTFIGKIDKESVSITAGNPTKFYLHDGEKLKLMRLPAGTRYIVSETGVEDGYTPSVQVIENGVQGEVIHGNEKDTLYSASEGNTNLVGEKENKAVFTNTYKDTPITGLIINALPFIILISVVVLAFTVLGFIKNYRLK